MEQPLPDDDSRDKFLCNDHPRPEVLKLAYEALMMNSANPTIGTYPELADSIGVDRKSLPVTAIEALHLTSRRADGKFFVVEPYPEVIQEIDSSIRFQAFLLNRIANGTWSGTRFTKQAHFLLAYEFLLRTDRPYLDYGSLGDLNDVNEYLKSRGYQAYSIVRQAKHQMKFNENKLHFWCILADYVGLTHPGPSGLRSRHFVYLREELLRAFLLVFLNEEKVTTGTVEKGRRNCVIDNFLDWSNRHFLLIPKLQSRNLPNPLACCLLRLEKAGLIELAAIGDAPSFLVPEALGSTEISRKVSVVVVRT